MYKFFKHFFLSLRIFELPSGTSIEERDNRGLNRESLTCFDPIHFLFSFFFLLCVKTIKRKNDPKSRRFGIPKSDGCREIRSAIDDFVGPYVVVVVVVSYKGKIV